jgi:hypothetical protein
MQVLGVRMPVKDARNADTKLTKIFVQQEMEEKVGKARRPPDMTAANAVVGSTQPQKTLADGNDSSPCHWQGHRPMSLAQLDAVVFDDDYLFNILGFVNTCTLIFIHLHTHSYYLENATNVYTNCRILTKEKHLILTKEKHMTS